MPLDLFGGERESASYYLPTGELEHHPKTLHGLPWDVIAHIIEFANLPTLKGISLVSRDFLMDSAPTLCRRFTISDF